MKEEIMPKFISKNFNKKIKNAISIFVSNPIKNTERSLTEHNYHDANLQFLKKMNIEF